MWVIWDFESNDWLRELPSKVDDGGVAVLMFGHRREAQERAAKHFGYEFYWEAKRDGWCEVVKVGVTCPVPPRQNEVVRKRGA